nr:hypothetical protein [Burkholderia paludis]
MKHIQYGLSGNPGRATMRERPSRERIDREIDEALQSERLAPVKQINEIHRAAGQLMLRKQSHEASGGDIIGQK